MREPISTTDAPDPAGSYSAGIRAGEFVFLAGQTPRRPDGVRLLDQPFEVQARQALDNLAAVAHAAGGSLADAVKVSVFVRPGIDVKAFDAIYRDYVSAPYPARTLTVSDLAIGEVEVDAILHLPVSRAGADRP
ncbi:RidA family protein [Microbacterium sp. NPDC079995]|uniref:RidA family protein n=1 Tax=unclassified Microbacterium TaxID=2609290 RepID=UPI00344BAAC5